MFELFYIGRERCAISVSTKFSYSDTAVLEVCNVSKPWGSWVFAQSFIYHGIGCITCLAENEV